MCKSSDKRYTLPMKNAEASVRMEGYQVTPQMREQCQRVLRGEVTTAELLRRGAQGAGQFSEADKLKKRMAAAFLFFVRYRWYSNSRSYILTMSPS